jgi:hypothetical protein
MAAAAAIGGGLLCMISLSGSIAYAMSGNAASNTATSNTTPATSNTATSNTATSNAATTTTPAPATTTTPAPATTTTPAPAATTPVAASLPVPYTTYEGAECFVPSYDLGYQGVKTAAEVQAACDANTRCAGATQHSGSDWWLLSGVHINNTTPGSGNKCILKSGKSIV